MYEKNIQEIKDFDPEIIRTVTVCLKGPRSCPWYYCDTLHKRSVLECKCSWREPIGMHRAIEVELSEDLRISGFDKIAIEVREE